MIRKAFAFLFIVQAALSSVTREQEMLLLDLIRSKTIVNLDVEKRTCSMEFSVWHAMPIKAKKRLAYFLASFCAR